MEVVALDIPTSVTINLDKNSMGRGVRRLLSRKLVTKKCMVLWRVGLGLGFQLHAQERVIKQKIN